MSGDSDKVLVTRARIAAGCEWDGYSGHGDQEPEIRRILRDCANRIETLAKELDIARDAIGAGRIDDWLRVQREQMEEIAAESRYAHDRLDELYELATRHNPKPPTPEVAAKFMARNEETLARIGPEKAWENIARALIPQLHSKEERAEVDDAWERWDDEREPHAKAKLQMELGERVAGLMEDRDALIVARSQAPDRMKVEIAECIHCESLTLNPESDQCACGGELYPVVKVVPPGTRVGDAGMGDVVLPKVAP